MDLEEFNNEYLIPFMEILDKENKNKYLMGDFNVDLFSPNYEYEQTLYSHNLIPTISIATHEKPGCNPSLIDNILVNSTCNVFKSGILENMVSHHLPLFCFTRCSISETKQTSSKMPKYDYNESNTDQFLNDIKTSIYDKQFQYTTENLNILVRLLTTRSKITLKLMTP